MDNSQSIKEKMLEVAQVLTDQGHIKGFGHVSVRISGTDRYLITGQKYTPARTMMDLSCEDIIVGSLDGSKVEGELTLPSEKFIHTCIYRSRDDVKAIVHSHPIYSMALSAVGKQVIPISTAALLFAPYVPIYEDSNLLNTEERGEKLVKLLGSGFAVVLKNHGTVTVGKNLEEAAGATLSLEDTAKVQLMASLAGEPKGILLSEIDEELSQAAKSGVGARSIWFYYHALFQKANHRG
ncbi:MAG: class II aldolase/adducin family protein [Thermodesulfobacteriota bacterium]